MPAKKKRELVRPAPLWKRLLAFIIDLLVLEFFVFSHFEQVIYSIAPVSKVLSSSAFAQFSILTGALGLLVFLYFTAFEYAIGQTLGHMAVNISLMMEEPRFLRIAISNLTFLPFFPFVLLWIIDPLMLLLSSNHQRFMHILMGIQVVEVYTLYGVNQWKL